MREGRPLVLVIAGPTASGKSRLAMELARLLPLEIVNADSMQVYRGLEIGTAKPGRAEREAVPHHLLDIREPDEPFSMGEYVASARAAVSGILARGRLPVLAGGTGLYIRGALHGVLPAPPRDERIRAELQAREEASHGTLHRMLTGTDPEIASRVPPADTVRLVRALEVARATGRPLSHLQREHAFADSPYRVLFLCLDAPRVLLYRWIEERVDDMVEKGLVGEVKGLLARGYGPGLTSMKAVGYREIAACLTGGGDLGEAVAKVKTSTRRYAKRQLTWFRAESGVLWLPIGDRRDVPALARRVRQLVEREEERI